MNRGNFKELQVWQKAMNICASVYKFSGGFPREEIYGLTNQIRRAGVSICSNIAEGNAKSSDKHFVIFLESALGSAYEVQTQFLLAVKLGYLVLDEHDGFEDEVIQVIRMLNGLIRRLSL